MKRNREVELKSILVPVDAAIRAVRDGTRSQSVSTETGALAFKNTPLPISLSFATRSG
jgi:hypothetical protein